MSKRTFTKTPSNKNRPVLPGYVVGTAGKPYTQRLVLAVRGDVVFWTRPEVWAVLKDAPPKERSMDVPLVQSVCSRRRFVTWCSGFDELRLPCEKERVTFGDTSVLTQDYYLEPYVP